MKQWLKNQYDIYTYRSYPLNLSTTIKSLFKTKEQEYDNQRNNLIGENNCIVMRPTVTVTEKCDKKGRLHNNRKSEKSRNNNDELTEHIWRRLSLQSYRKKKQQKQEEKSKPIIAAVLRTYDKRGVPKEGSSADWL